MLNTLNGALFNLADLASLLSRIHAASLLDNELRQEAGRHRDWLKKLVTDARQAGYHWIWREEELVQESRGPVEGLALWRLPSAEIIRFLKPAPCHNKIEAHYTKIFGKDPDIYWDTEASAIYPEFKTREAGKRFIANIDRWVDFTLFAIPLPAKKKKSDTKKDPKT